MQIAIITVKREPMYLYDTIDSLVLATPEWTIGRKQGNTGVDVFVGTPDFEEIAERLSSMFHVHRISDGLWQLIEPLPPRLRAVGNFVAALRSGDDDLMIFEDDIAIKPGWLEALHKIYGSPHTFISLYSHRYFPIIETTRRNNLHCPAVWLDGPIKDRYYGTLGLFIPAAHRLQLANNAMLEIVPTNPFPPNMRSPFDGVVKNYIDSHPQCRLAISIPSYVDHRGDVSTMNPSHGIRRSPMF